MPKGNVRPTKPGRNSPSWARGPRIFALCKYARCAPEQPRLLWASGSRCGKKPTRHAWALTMLDELPTANSSALGRGCVETLNDTACKLQQRRSIQFLVNKPTDADLVGLQRCTDLLYCHKLQQRAHAPTDLIAFIIASNPKILKTRLKLYASTFRLISAPTLGNRRVRKCV
jgi:hypothetical protein